jgi:hypothetical protein
MKNLIIGRIQTTILYDRESDMLQCDSSVTVMVINCIYAKHILTITMCLSLYMLYTILYFILNLQRHFCSSKNDL